MRLLERLPRHLVLLRRQLPADVQHGQRDAAVGLLHGVPRRCGGLLRFQCRSRERLVLVPQQNLGCSTLAITTPSSMTLSVVAIS